MNTSTLSSIVLGASLLPAPFTQTAQAGKTDNSCFAPRLLGSVSLESGADFMTVRDHLAYIIDSSSRTLSIVDVSDPEAMAVLSTTELVAFDPVSISFSGSGDTAYISWDNSGFSVYDISDPYDPWFVRPYNIQTDPPLIVANGAIFNAQSMLDVSRPSAPHLALETDTFGRIVAADAGTAYTACLGLVDISDPFNQALLAEDQPSECVDDLIIDAPSLYGRTGTRLSVFERTSPTTIATRGAFAHTQSDAVARGSLIFSIGNALDITDVSNPQDPLPVATYEGLSELGDLSQIELEDNVFYITDSGGTLGAYRIDTNPVATLITSGLAQDLKIVGDLAFVAADSAGLQIFDISDPQHPTLLSTTPTANTALNVDVDQGVAYIAAHQAGLDILDVSDPAGPVRLATYDTGRSTRDVKIRDGLAFVADRINGLFILDISDPADPLLVSTTDTPGWAGSITLAGDLAIMPHGHFDLQILDISDPGSPVILSSITPLDTTDTGINLATVVGDILYTAESEAGYRVFNIADPAAPIGLATINTDTGAEIGFAHQIVTDGAFLYLANGSAGFNVYNNFSPTSPQLIASYPARSFQGNPISSIRRIVLEGGLAYLPAYNGGLRIYEPLGCQQAPCDADITGDGELNFSDISLFVKFFQQQLPPADFRPDGVYNFFDITDFLAAYGAGCP